MIFGDRRLKFFLLLPLLHAPLFLREEILMDTIHSAAGAAERGYAAELKSAKTPQRPTRMLKLGGSGIDYAHQTMRKHLGGATPSPTPVYDEAGPPRGCHG